MANVEHVLQIEVTIDDEAIRQAALASATKKLTEGVTKIYFDQSYMVARPRRELVDLVDKRVKELVEQNKEYLLNAIVKEASSKLMRTKKFKEEIFNKLDKTIE